MDNERSGLWFEDSPGAPTVSEIEAAVAALDQPFDLDAALAANPLPTAPEHVPYPEPSWAKECTPRPRRQKRAKPSDKVINQCPDRRVDIPVERQANSRRITRAADLTEGQVYFLAETMARCGDSATMAEWCQSLFKFSPSPEEVEHLEWVIAMHTEWKDPLELARIGWDAWYEQRYGHPYMPFPPMPKPKEQHHTH